MEVELLTENIEKHLSTLSRMLPTHTQVPVLSNLLLEANKNGFFIKATDLEIGAIVKIPAKINKEGSITVPGKQFIETVSNLPKDKMLISTKEESLKMSVRDNRVNFQAVNASEFPELIKAKGEKVVSLSKSDFDNFFNHLSFSASTDDVKPHLTGIYMTKKDSLIELVATDGYRLTIKSIDSKSLSDFKDSIIVSTQVVGEAMNIKSESIDMYVNAQESQVVFEGGDISLVGRLIDGKFPPYEKVVPKNTTTEVVVDKDDFMQNVKLAGVFAKDQSNIVSVNIENSQVKLSSKTSGVGEGEFFVECEKEGEDNNIAFNIRYLMDALKNFEGQKVTMKLSGPLQPALFTDEKNTFRHVIMPIKTD